VAAKNEVGAGAPTDCEIVGVRYFVTSPEKVYAAFADPARLARWWGPTGFTNTVEKLDLRPGGEYSITMHGPDGKDYPNESVFVEVEPARRVVYDHLRPMHRFLMTQTYEEIENQTQLTWRMRFESAEECERVRQFVVPANEQNFDRLAEELRRVGDETTADREIVVSRAFDAPRELVFEAWTKPEHVARWWGPNGFTTTTESMDVRPGGVWKYLMHGPDGTDYPNRIEYINVERPARLVFLHGSGPDRTPGADFHTTATFDEIGGKTVVTMRSVFPTAALREIVVRDFKAIEGGKQTLARLAEYVAGM
jgi:uncharacterized protein YndB with AHSA1/START domain